MEYIDYNYYFAQNDGLKKSFQIILDKKSLNLINSQVNNPPIWTDLEFCKCPNCTLDSSEYKSCPVALGLIDIIDFFKNSESFEDADISIETHQRVYSKKTSLQKGVSSLIGIIMVTSNCPILSKLKPMVKFHLPFASSDETLYRTISMYLIKQYFRYKKGNEPDWDMKELIKIYQEIHKVNRAFYKRIASIEGMDANVNALIILDNFANYVNFTLDKEKFTKLEAIFDDLE